MGTAKGKKVLVAGGGGFVGLALVKRLVREGFEVTSFSRNRYSVHQELGINTVIGDITDAHVVKNACKGMDAVFHTAAKVEMWGRYKEFYDVNVIGTENIIEACIENEVPHLVFTSSASVVFDGNDIEGGDETLPYPDKGESHYAHTKMLAEQRVVQASGKKLKTISLRPHLIYGPGDTQLVPRIIEKAKSGRIRRIGKKQCLIDTTHIDNFTEAQIQAYEKLVSGSDVSGKAYFITNGQPVETWEFINGILKENNLTPVQRTVPKWLALTVAALFEITSRITGRPPLLTQFLVKEMSTSHWFDISAAKRDLQLLHQPVQNRNQ